MYRANRAFNFVCVFVNENVRKVKKTFFQQIFALAAPQTSMSLDNKKV